MIELLQKTNARGPLARALLLGSLPLALCACGETEDAEDIAVDDVEVATAPIPDFGPVQVEPQIQGPIEASDCNLARAEDFIGEEADSDTRYRLLDQVAPLTNVRWLGPDEETGEELRPDRLNVMLDADDVITAVSCG